MWKETLRVLGEILLYFLQVLFLGFITLIKLHILEIYFDVWCVIGIFFFFNSYQLTRHIYREICSFHFVLKFKFLKMLGMF